MSGRPDPGEPGRYFAWLYSPAPQQRLLETLFAIEQEVRAALRPGMEHRVAHLRLQWWQEECARLGSGEAVHPLTRTLAGLCPGRIDLSGLVGTARWDLASATFATRAELAEYCASWARAVTEPAACCAVAADQRTAAAAFGRALGASLREAELLARARVQARAGRLRLPLDELERAGIAPEQLAAPEWTAPLCTLIRSRCRELRGAFARAAGQLPGALQPPLRGLLVWAALGARECARIERALPADGPPGILGRLGAAMRAWRAARAADQQRFSL